MNHPSHEAVSQRAYQLWQNSDSPSGRDNEFWLEAERQLKAETSDDATEQRPLSPIPEAVAAKAEAQKKHEAFAPIVPRHTGPKTKPAPTGKPLWDKAHSA